jgi:hypothetical protein
VRRDHPHHDSGGHDEDKAFKRGPEFFNEFAQLAVEPVCPLPRLAGVFAGDEELSGAEPLPEPRSEPGAVAGYGDDGDAQGNLTGFSNKNGQDEIRIRLTRIIRIFRI